MRNEFGDEFTLEEIQEVASRVARLSRAAIDELWSRCGWRDSKRGARKSLPSEVVEEIKNNAPKRIRRVVNLLTETPKREVLRNLSLLENRPQS